MSVDKETKKARIVSLLFIAAIVLVCAGLISAVLFMPYDTGVLAPTNLSGNLALGGAVCPTADYIFYADNQGIVRIDRGNGDELRLYDGTSKYLNAIDGWLYFVSQNEIYKIAYYGEYLQKIPSNPCASMSVNGVWIYYADLNGRLYKMRDDGSDVFTLSNGENFVRQFIADNRLVVYGDGETFLRVMNTDGTNDRVLDTGNITYFTYTLDELFYLKDGIVTHIASLAARFDAHLVYEPFPAEVFNYNTDTYGRGKLYYYADGALYMRLLACETSNAEETVLIRKIDDLKAIYSLAGQLFYIDSAGKLYSITLNNDDNPVSAVGGTDKLSDESSR